QVAYSGQIAVLKCSEEIREVVLMVGLVRPADRADGTWAQVVWICGVAEVHERLVVRNVIAGVYNGIVTGKARVMLPANGAALSVNARRRESALEPTPGNALGVQQIANVLAGHRNLVNVLKFGIGRDAIIIQGTGISDYRTGCCSAGDVPSSA